MIFAVIDTNVLVAAALTHNSDSPTQKIVRGLFYDEYTIMYDEDILAEYKEVLSRPKFNITESEINNLITFIRHHGIHSSRVPFLEPMPDEKDRVFYEIALTKEDSYLVTGNLKHFPKTPQVVTPAEMLAILEQQ
ncbi:MAG: putative toxin-antitoxin system toxin component, PIN family [Paludibacteraceae bacterium]|nr:putative toxin-antitoxin system toxin component, PIN family [Paludibacteraceae bacterium]